MPYSLGCGNFTFDSLSGHKNYSILNFIFRPQWLLGFRLSDGGKEAGGEKAQGRACPPSPPPLRAKESGRAPPAGCFLSLPGSPSEDIRCVQKFQISARSSEWILPPCLGSGLCLLTLSCMALAYFLYIFNHLEY